MASTIISADSIDSYASTAEMTSSGRWWYLPTNTTSTVSVASLAPGAGRYGGNALCMQTTSTSGNGYGTEYYSTTLAPINVPSLTPVAGQLSKTWANLQGTSIAFAFWFRANVPTGTAATVPLIMTTGNANAGNSSTVLGATTALNTGNLLSASHSATSATPTTVTLNACGYQLPVVSGACPVDVLDGNWHWIELGIVFSVALGANYPSGPNVYYPTSGFGSSWATCYIDQNLIFTMPNLVSAGTLNAGATYTADLAAFFLPHFGVATTTGTGQGFFYDDLIVMNYTNGGWPLGPRRIGCMRPNADGSIINFTPVGASDNYLAVNVGYTNTSSYVQSTGYNQEDRYKFPALSYVPQNVNAVVTNIQAGNFENGTTIGMEPTMYDGTNAELVGARTTLPTMKYGPIQTIYGTDGGGNTWVSSEINSIQVGFKTVQ